jgi:nucleotide-binding universal stress UspA family protein
MKILVAVDGSPSSQAAVAEVARRPWPEKTEVRLLTADPPTPSELLPGASPSTFDEVVRAQRRVAVENLDKALAVLTEQAPQLSTTTTLVEGFAKDAIVTEAENWGADLVVVGSHGYGPIRRFFLGSVSTFVAQRAPCSVLIVRPPQTAESTTAASNA